MNCKKILCAFQNHIFFFFSLAVNHRKRSIKPDGPELPSPKQLCLGTTSPKEHSPVNICAPNKVFTSRPNHSQIVALPPNVMFTTPGQVGGAVNLVQTGSNGQPTLIQTPTLLPATSGGAPVSILQAAPNRPASFIPMSANGISLSNGHTHAPMNVIQTMAGGQQIRLITHPSPLTNRSTQHHGQPLQVINTSALNLEQGKLPITTSTIKRVSPSPPAVIRSPIEKNLHFHHSLSSITSSPPPLVQVIKTEPDVSHKSCSPPPPPHTHAIPPQSLMTIKTIQQQSSKPSFEATATATHPAQAIPMQSIILPTSSLQQQPMGRILLIAADGTGLDTSGATLLPIRTLVEAPQFAQNPSFGLPIQVLKVAPNSIPTN